MHIISFLRSEKAKIFKRLIQITKSKIHQIHNLQLTKSTIQQIHSDYET